MLARSLTALLTLWVLAALPVAGQPTPANPSTAQMSEDLAGIRRALDRLVATLESNQRHLEMDLLLKRIELYERRIEPMERRLRSVENEITGIERQLENLDQMKVQHDEYLDSAIRDGNDPQRSESRRILDDIERSRQGAEQRLEKARLRVQEIENDLASGRREIEILDEMLLEMIEAERP